MMLFSLGRHHYHFVTLPCAPGCRLEVMIESIEVFHIRLLSVSGKLRCSWPSYTPVQASNDRVFFRDLQSVSANLGGSATCTKVSLVIFIPWRCFTRRDTEVVNL